MRPAIGTEVPAATGGTREKTLSRALGTLGRDSRRFLRGVGGSPLYSLVVIVTLALGIGPTSAIFSLVNSLLLQPLPYADSERLVLVWQTNPKMGWKERVVATGNFIDWRERGRRTFDRMAAMISIQANLTGQGRPERLAANLVSDDFFSALGTRVIQGRMLGGGDFQPGQDHVMLLSEGLWRRRFGADPGAIGRKVILNGEPYTIVGVTPPGFQFAEPVDLWLPLAVDTLDTTNRSLGSLVVLGRLRPGGTVRAAQAEMDRISAALSREFPDTNSETGSRVVSLREQLVGELRPILYVLLGAAVFVLLIACANVTELMLTRIGGRETEVAVRVALGGLRRDIVRPILFESMALGVAGGLLGLVIAAQLIAVFVAMLPDVIPNVDRMGINLSVLGFTLLVSALTGAVVALVPALRLSRPDLARLLKGAGERGSTGAGHQRILKVLVVSEVALALLLLVAAGLMTVSFLKLRQVNAGFRTANLLTLKLFVPPDRYPENAAVTAFAERLDQSLRGLPGVAGTAAVNHLPLGRTNATRYYVVEGRPRPEPGQFPRANYRVITPGYFQTLGIPLLSGRDFNAHDTEQSPPVVVISESMAKSVWPGESPLGKRLSLDPDAIVWAEVVGVVGDIKYRQLDEEPAAGAYVPLRQAPLRELNWTLRTVKDPAGMAPAVYRVIQALDADLPVSEIATMESLVDRSLVTRRLSARLFAVLAGVAFLLGVLGLYGVIAYQTSRRTREIGIRIALGARRRQVLALVVRQGMTLVGLGLAIGLALALALSRLMKSLLFEVSALDPLTLTLAALLLAGVGMASILIASRKGTSVHPMVALRGE